MSLYNNIFLIEDDLNDQKFFIGAIKEINNSVKYTIAYNVEDALAKLKILRHLPDLIFLGINMPRMNGFEFLKHLKTKQVWDQIPVIVLSTSTNVTQQAHQFGANAYITKPFSHSKLQCEIENVLNLIGRN